MKNCFCLWQILNMFCRIHTIKNKYPYLITFLRVFGYWCIFEKYSYLCSISQFLRQFFLFFRNESFKLFKKIFLIGFSKGIPHNLLNFNSLHLL